MSFDNNFGRPERLSGTDDVSQRLSLLADAFGVPVRRSVQIQRERDELSSGPATSFCSTDDAQQANVLRNRLRELERQAQEQGRRLTMADLTTAGFTPENLLRIGESGTAALLHQHIIEVNLRGRMVDLMSANPNITPQQLLEQLGQQIPLEGFPPGNVISRHPGLAALRRLSSCRFNEADVPLAMQDQLRQNAMAMLLIANHNNWNQSGAPAGDVVSGLFRDASLFRNGRMLETYLGALQRLSPDIQETVRARWRNLYQQTLDDVYPLTRH